VNRKDAKALSEVILGKNAENGKRKWIHMNTDEHRFLPHFFVRKRQKTAAAQGRFATARGRPFLECASPLAL
jgi:hypothetical protein